MKTERPTKGAKAEPREKCQACGNQRTPYRPKGSKFDFAPGVLRIDGEILVRACGKCTKTLPVLTGIEKVS